MRVNTLGITLTRAKANGHANGYMPVALALGM
jgi:hypothetical protein